MNKNYLFNASELFSQFGVLLVLFLLCAENSQAQAPGGVNANLTGWFNATSAAGTDAASPIRLNNVTENRVSSWTSSGGSNSGTYSITQGTTSRMPVYTLGNTASANFNFNPFVQFNSGGNTLLSNTGGVDLMGAQGSVFVVVNTYNNTVPKNTAFTYYVTNRWQFKPGFRTQTGDGFGGSTGDYYFDVPYPGGQATHTYPETSGIILLGKGVNTSTTSNTFSAKRNGDAAGLTNIYDPVYHPAVSFGFYLGSNNGSEVFSGAVAEVITYDVNLTDADVNKVESYLAVKYGVTLTTGQSTTNSDYTAPDGSVFWAADNTFKFNVTGIGREDASGLYQKQSKSVHNNTLITVYNKNTVPGTFLTNASNTSTIDATSSYFMTADNGLGNTTVPGYCVNRIARTWKVQKTGSVTDVTISAAKSELPADIKYLVVSSDPAFPAAAVTTYELDDNGTSLYKNVNIPTGYYFTYGTDQEATATDYAIGCEEITTSVTATGLGVWTADASNPGAVIIADATANTTGISGFTVAGEYKFNWGSPECFITVTITFSGPVPAAPAVSPVTYCQGQTAVPLTAQAAAGYTLTWLDENGTALAGAPTPDTSATATLNYSVYQTSPEGCNSPAAMITVTVNAAQTAITAFTLPASVCFQDANVVPEKDDNFTEGGTFTATPNGLQINAETGEIDLANSDANTYTVTYTVVSDAENCIAGDSDSATIIINSAPVLLEPATLRLCDNDYDGFAEFNLEAEGIRISNGQTGLTLTYYRSLADAQSGNDAIITPAAYTSQTPGTQTVYVSAIETGASSGCVTIKEIVLIVDPKPAVPVVSTYSLCDDMAATDVQATFNLTTKNAEATNGVTGLTVSYYTTQAAAEAGTTPILDTESYTSSTADIWVRVEFATGCYSVSSFRLEVPLPVANTIGAYELCEESTDEAVFNLSSRDVLILPSGATDAVSYFTTQADADANQNAITTPGGYTNVSNPQIIYVRVSNTVCYTTTSFTISALEVPVLPDALSLTGCSPYNLTEVAAQLEAGFTLEYYTSEADAVADTDAIIDPTAYRVNNLTFPVYVRVENTNGCFDVVPVTLVRGNCEIQRGISPGQTAGQNDNFDLVGFNVRKLSVFNRYGREVYSFNGNYTNQWGGQTSSGDELPTGAYFYAFETNSGENKTGWIYINR